VRRAFPDRSLEELTVDHPVFHSFHDFESLDLRPPFGHPLKPLFYGLHDENGRLLLVANFNNDLGDFWEWGWTLGPGYEMDLGTPEEAQQALDLGINYIVYALQSGGLIVTRTN
jgi:hypothetical protein